MNKKYSYYHNLKHSFILAPLSAQVYPSISVSLLCPVYNEVANLAHIIRFFNAIKLEEKELLIIDGQSTDHTKEIIEQSAMLNPCIKYLENPNRYVPHALNIAIKKATGLILIRIDAHTNYREDYVEKILHCFERTGADIVGGPMRIAKGNPIQHAIGYATGTAFGVGNSSFHFESYEGYTDSVYLGAWKREIFSSTGLFDTSFKRNQDDEFHYRARHLGFKIYQDPEIVSWYQPRKKILALFSQYFQYGLYKPKVLKKIPRAFQWRHLIPACFFIYLLLLPLLFSFFSVIIFLPLAMYIIANFYFSLLSNSSFVQFLRIAAVYFTIHFAYGLGFVSGTIALFQRKKSCCTESQTN